MCINPTPIPNPNYKAPLNRGVNYLKNTTTQYIYVPCNHCPECLALRQIYYTQRVEIENIDRDLFYCTLTYNENVPTLTLPDGSTFKYPSYDDIRLFIKRLRRENIFGAPFRYFCVSEYGGKRHRPHFHIIFSLPRIYGHDSEISNETRALELKWRVFACWSRNISKAKKKPIYIPLCTYAERGDKHNYEFTYINRYRAGNSIADVSFYTSKYILKFSEWFTKFSRKLYYLIPDDKQRKDVLSLITPHAYISKHFGACTSPAQIEHMNFCRRQGLILHLPSVPFINPVSSAVFPLSPYYRDTWNDITTAIEYYYNNDGYNVNVDSFVDTTTTAYEYANKYKIDMLSFDRHKAIMNSLSKRFDNYDNSEEYEL